MCMGCRGTGLCRSGEAPHPPPFSPQTLHSATIRRTTRPAGARGTRAGARSSAWGRFAAATPTTPATLPSTARTTRLTQPSSPARRQSPSGSVSGIPPRDPLCAELHRTCAAPTPTPGHTPSTPLPSLASPSPAPSADLDCFSDGASNKYKVGACAAPTCVCGPAGLDHPRA